MSISLRRATDDGQWNVPLAVVYACESNGYLTTGNDNRLYKPLTAINDNECL